MDIPGRIGRKLLTGRKGYNGLGNTLQFPQVYIKSGKFNILGWT
jgi:hypothetical protein